MHATLHVALTRRKDGSTAHVVGRIDTVSCTGSSVVESVDPSL